MNDAPNIAAHGDSEVLSAEGSRQGRMSSRLQRLMAATGVVQEDFEHVGVEQSRVSRWCNPRKRETIPHHCVISARTGVPLAACVRDALDLWLAAQREPRAASVYATSDERAADGVFAAAEVGR